MRKLYLIAIFLLAGCATDQQLQVNAAYMSLQEAKARAVEACANSRKPATCSMGAALIFSGGGSDSIPVVQSTLSTVLNSSVLGVAVGAGIGAVRDIRVAQSQERQNIAATQANAATQGAMFGAISGIAGSGFNAVSQVSRDGTTAITATAQAGLNASTAGVLSLERVSSTAINASAQTAQAITRMPPTNQYGDNAVVGDGNDQSRIGRDQVRGDGNETARQVACQSQGGNGGSASGAGGSSGTTGASGSANPSAGSGAPATNNCGGG